MHRKELPWQAGDRNPLKGLIAGLAPDLQYSLGAWIWGYVHSPLPDKGTHCA